LAIADTVQLKLHYQGEWLAMEKVWLNSYPKSVPPEIKDSLYQCINDVFVGACGQYQDRKAFSNFGTSLHFHELAEQSQQFALALQETLQIKKGDRVALMLPNILQYPIALFGLLRIGAIVVNVNPLYTAPELCHQLCDSGAETILVLSQFAHVVEEVLPKTSLKHVIITDIGDCFSRFKSFVYTCAGKFIHRAQPKWSLPDALRFKELMKVTHKELLSDVEVYPSDIAFLQYTGGTTGVAKGAMLTHSNILANLQQASLWLQQEKLHENEIVITALPLYHIFSLLMNCLFYFSLGAENVLITNPRDTKGFLRTIQKIPFTVIAGVNTLFNSMMNNPHFKKCDFSHLHLSIGGGAAVQKSVADRWCQLTNSPIIEAYGLTETSPAVSINLLGTKGYTGSIGLPLSSTEIKLLNEAGEEVGIDQAGELAIKGPQVMAGYWNNISETEKVMTEDGYFLTGDIATMDQQGFLRIVDRKKDMINVSGFNVYPNEVEEVISLHPDVLEVAVVPVIDAGIGGEVVKAVIVKKNERLTKVDVIQHCERSLTLYKVPKRIEFRLTLPKSPVGKILRRELRD
jgi:long-chain acyl-CoA synthetase